MRLIFIDEIEQPKHAPKFFGVAGLFVNSSHYSALRRAVEDALDAAKWNRGEEFKGRFIFSSTKGDDSVPVDRRIELVRTIVSATTAKRNARVRFCFAYNDKGKNAENYLDLVAKVTAKCPQPENAMQDKPLVSMYCDYLSDVKPKNIEDAVTDVLACRRLRPVEMPAVMLSSNSTAGLIAADVLAFIESWDILFPDLDEAQQAELFQAKGERLADKLAAVRELLNLVKEVEVIDPGK
jgi:hypothetical protein